MRSAYNGGRQCQQCLFCDQPFPLLTTQGIVVINNSKKTTQYQKTYNPRKRKVNSWTSTAINVFWTHMVSTLCERLINSLQSMQNIGRILKISMVACHVQVCTLYHTYIYYFKHSLHYALPFFKYQIILFYFHIHVITTAIF